MTHSDKSLSSGFLFSALVVVGAAIALSGCRSYPACKNDQHCVDYNRGTPFCVDGTCRECRNDANCGVGMTCNGGVCRGIPGYCDPETPCPSPQVCRDNRCGPQCLSDAECPGPHGYCQGGLCMTGECTTDGDCQDGFRCEGRACRPIPVAAAPCADGSFRTILFDFDDSRLTTQAQSDLQWNMQCFDARSGQVTIEGHCDERGTEEYNLALGERRARSVRDFFTRSGVAAARLRTVSFGESRPADPRSNEAAWRANRRAEFKW
jgi:peptidoglycan-associated lipoprotein